LLAQLSDGRVLTDFPIATEPKLVVRHSTMKHN